MILKEGQFDIYEFSLHWRKRQSSFYMEKQKQLQQSLFLIMAISYYFKIESKKKNRFCGNDIKFK